MKPKLILVLFGALTTLAHAQAPSGYLDAGRIEQLESEIRAIKQRLSKIESAQGGSTADPTLAATGSGWKSISSWRQLKTGMSPNEVRTILGEPNRVNGGGVAYWYYTNGGETTFVRDKLSGWSEPK